MAQRDLRRFLTRRLQKLHSIRDRQRKRKSSVGRGRRPRRTERAQRTFYIAQGFVYAGRAVRRLRHDVSPYRWTDCISITHYIKNSTKTKQTLRKAIADPACGGFGSARGKSDAPFPKLRLRPCQDPSRRIPLKLRAAEVFIH